MTFEELKQILFSRSNFGMKLGLERMREALFALGEPHRAQPALHVAGTNGKGSTCAFAEASLRAAGLRTGFYTSPHLVHFCERIRIDGAPISEERACALLERIRAGAPWTLERPPEEGGLTFFELATLMAFLAFAEAGVEAAVIEVGLGGRLDATNVLDAPLACAIAPLGLDHAQWLGSSLREIAAEKAGILKAGVPAVSAGQPREAAAVLQARADEVGSPLWRPGRDYAFESRDDRPFCYRRGWTVRPGALGLAGHHQRGNAALACALLEAAASRGLRVSARDAEAGLRAARWPGRLELLAGAPEVYVDGAHNPHAARALARSLPALLSGRPLHLVFGALADKDAGGMLAALGPLAAAVYACTPDSPRAVPAEALTALWPARPFRRVEDALDAARSAAGPGGVVLIAGSLYLVGEARSLLLGQTRLSMPAERL